MSEVKSVSIGIDVAKDSLEVASFPEGFQLAVPNTPQGHKDIVANLALMDVKLVAMEATGGYERTVAAELLAAGYQTVVINPRRIRDFAHSAGRHAKTDSIDAAVIAHFADVIKPKPREPKTAEENTISELVGRRRQLVDLLTQEKNRQPMARLPRVKKSIKKMIEALQKQIAQIEELIGEQIKCDQELNRKDAIIQSVAGVGPKTSAMLLGRLPELGQINRREIAALAGVAPYDFASGNFRGRSMVWGGRAEVRAVLYMATVSAIQWNETISEFAQRLTAAGKPYKVVATACMRKLLVILNTMVRNNTTWQSKNSSKNS